jgi:3-oxoacyl-[acyl-carrier-protein] synthase II
MQNVVLTGMGAVTARGDWTLKGGSTPDAGEAPAHFAIENFALENYLSSPKTYLDRCSALALAGCALALRDAKIETPVAGEKFGVTLGTHFGCVETMKTFWDKAMEKGVRLANPLLFSHSYFNSPISLCAIEFGLKGTHGTFCAHENSGLEAVRAAFDAIRLGHAEAMLCGGVDALSPARALFAPQDNAGEASVFFVLENESHARSRDAGSTPSVNEAWFQNDWPREEIAKQFGDCAGAGSTLALARRAMNFRR